MTMSLEYTWSMMRSMILEHPLISGLFVFWIGCCIGSFLNVCIYRVPNGMSLLYPPSHCPHCDHRIRWYENIPLFSFLGLRGQCSGCGKPISPRYFYVELMTGLLYYGLFAVLIYGRNGRFDLIPLYAVAAAVAICSAFTDCEYRVIPNSFNLLLLLTGLVNASWGGLEMLFAGESGKQFLHSGDVLSPLLLSAASCAAVGGCLWFFALLSRMVFHRECLGMGDVKYMAAIAACFYYIPAILILLAACVLGIVTVGIYRLFDKRRSGRVFPFGPFLSGAVLLWMFLGWLTEGLFMKFYPGMAEILFHR